MSADSFNRGTRRFMDPESGTVHAVTPDHKARFRGYLSDVYTLEFDPPIHANSDAAFLLKRAGAQLIYVDEEKSPDFDQVETAVLVPGYASTFVSPRGETVISEELQYSLRDRAGALIEGMARQSVENHRLDHQLQ